MAKENSCLARVELIAPSQERDDGGQTLFANVWFPPQEHSFSIDGQAIVLRYGFTEADLMISDSHDSRYRKILKTLHSEETYTRSAESVGKTEKGLGGGVSTSNIPFVKGKAEASTHSSDTTNEKREETQTRLKYIAEPVDSGRWRLQGHAHEHGLLHGAIIHEDTAPLCTVKYDVNKGDDTQPLEISAEVITTQRRLRAIIIDDAHGRETPNKAERAAAVQAVIARALRVWQPLPDSDEEENKLLLATDKIELRVDV
jgi:hypothetical protein